MPQLPGVVRSADPAVLGFDTNTPLTRAIAEDMKSRGFHYCIRYVARTAKPNSIDLSRTEAEIILAAGLALMVVQHPRAEGWQLAPIRYSFVSHGVVKTGTEQSMGGSDGAHAAYHALLLGFPPAVNVWCDLEGIAGGAAEEDVIQYCNDWHDAVAAAGYVPGVYVGAQAILDDTQLFRDLKFDHYWKSLSNVPDIESRGYQMIQSNQHMEGAIEIDNNLTRTDNLGGRVQWLAPQ